MIRILFVCLGNICRSPMAEFVMKQMVAEKGLADQFEIASAATEGYNEMVHEALDYRKADMLRQMKVPYTQHYSRQIRKSDYDKFDYILAMDDNNVRDILDIVGGTRTTRFIACWTSPKILVRLRILGTPVILMRPIGIFMKVARHF